MSASPSDTHYAKAGDQFVACGPSARSVMLRSDNRDRVTCAECRRSAGIRGPIQESAKNIARAGKVLEKAVRDYGSIGQHQKKRRR